MKSKIRSFGIGIIIGFSLLVACESDPVPETSIEFSIEPTGTIYAGDPVDFTFIGEAEKITIFTGDDLHVYDSLPFHTGFAVEGNAYTYEYNSMGNFKVVVVATSLGHWGQKEDMKTAEIYVDVIDNRTQIDKIDLKVLSNKKKYTGEIESDQIIFNEYEGESLELVECTLRLMSPGANIYMNGDQSKAYADREKFKVDLSDDPQITIVAPDGSEKKYKVLFLAD